MFTVPSNIDLILGLGLGLPLGLILSLLVLLLMCLLCRRRRRARRSSTDSEFSSVDPWVLIDAFRQLDWFFFFFSLFKHYLFLIWTVGVYIIYKIVDTVNFIWKILYIVEYSIVSWSYEKVLLCIYITCFLYSFLII